MGREGLAGAGRSYRADQPSGHAGQAQLYPRVRIPRRTCSSPRPGSRARTGVVRPPGPRSVRFGDAAAARCGEHCRVNPPPPPPECSQFGRWPGTRTHSVGQRGILAARLAGRLNRPRLRGALGAVVENEPAARRAGHEIRCGRTDRRSLSWNIVSAAQATWSRTTKNNKESPVSETSPGCSSRVR